MLTNLNTKITAKTKNGNKIAAKNFYLVKASFQKSK